MSVVSLVQDAAMARLRASPALAGVALFDAPPVRAALPYAVLDEPLVTDAGAVGWDGRELKLSLLVHDGGERPVRLRGLAGAAEEALLSLDGTLAEGWRIVGAALVRSRLVRGGERWTAGIDVRCRVWRPTGGEK